MPHGEVIDHATEDVPPGRIKGRCLKAVGFQNGLLTATSDSLLFRQCQEPGAKALLAHILLDPKHLDMQCASPGKAGQSSQDRTIRRAHKNGERTIIAVASHLEIELIDIFFKLLPVSLCWLFR